jgi:nitrogen fixation-related uncharacterized protein
MLAVAVANLAQVLLDVLLQPAAALSQIQVRDAVSINGSAALVGLPVWLLHWLWISRIVRGTSAERVSTLRRLYLYGLLAGATAFFARSVFDGLLAGFDALIGLIPARSILDSLVRPVPFALVAAVVWFGHWRITTAERDAVGESGGSATLRRWYVYGAAFAGLIMMLIGSQSVFETLWRVLAGGESGVLNALPVPAAAAVVGLGLWLFHWSVLPGQLPSAARSEDATSVLRSAYLFLGLAVGVVGALAGVSQLLYYVVGRLLGVDRPGGVGGDLLQAAAGPVGVTLVYGAAWAYARAALRRQAAEFGETQRQAGIRRLYTYVVALVSIGVLGTAVAGLLWGLADVIVRGAVDPDLLARYTTLTLVGLPVWLLHWKPSPADPVEAHSLARRLYIYLSLIAAMLSLIGSAATALYRLLGLALGEPLSAAWQADFGHALAISVVGGFLAVYQWRVLRADARRAEPARATAAAQPVEAVVEIHAADQDSLSRALSVLRLTGVQVTVRLQTVANPGLTDDDAPPRGLYL